jgi:O-antigen/teichoic acid export membrane protein
MTAAGVRASAPASGGVSKSIVTVLFGNAFPPLVSLITGPILAQSLGVDGRGVVAAATAPFALVTAIVTLGVPEAVTYVVARSPGLLRHALRRGVLLLLLAGITATVAVVVASPVLTDGDAEIRRLMLLACLAIVPNMLVGALRGVSSALRRWHLVTFERASGALLKLALLVPFWLTDNLTPLVATVILAAVPVLGALPYLALLRNRPEADAGPAPREATMRGLMSYGSRIWAGSISGIILTRVDQTLIAPLGSPAALGLYVVAVSVSELPLIINSAVRDVTFVSEAAGSEDGRLAMTARVSAFVCALAGLAIGISMIWWLPLLFGDDFAAAVPVAAVLLVAVVAGTPGSIAGSALSGRGRPGLRSWSLVIACVVNIGLLVALVPSLGAMGAALATLAGNLVASNLNLVFARVFFGISPWAFYGLRRGDLGVVLTAVRRLASRARRRPAGAR